MEPEEVSYRALLAVVYWELTKDLDTLHILYEKSESCSAIAAAVAALRLASGMRTSASPIEEAEEADHGLVLAGPYREGLGELVLKALGKIRNVAVLHTPAYFAVSEMPEFQDVARSREVRYAVREEPGEITYYKLTNGVAKAVGVRKLSSYEQKIVRMYEQLNM